MGQPAGTGDHCEASRYFSRDFNMMKAWAELGDLARAPYDLTAPGALSPARIRGYRAHAAGIDLLYSTQRVDEAVLSALQRLAEESGAVAQFLLMKKGAVLNRIDGYPSEERQVLHTACRDIFGPVTPASDAAAVQAQGKGELEKLADFLAALDAGKNRDDIVADFVSRYGQMVLASPPPEGYKLLAWIAPIVALLLGVALVRTVLLRWRRDHPQAQPAPAAAGPQGYNQRLQQELKDFDAE